MGSDLGQFAPQDYKLGWIPSAQCCYWMCWCSHGLGAHIIADGGCTCPGDVAKGFGGGADFVMLGGMLAGHDEGKGKLVNQMDQNILSFMDQVQRQNKNTTVFQITEVVKVELLELNIGEK